jgi:hypothetical protein
VNDHINIWSKSTTALGRVLSNFAHTPFVLDGVHYASVEALWYVLHGASLDVLAPLHGWEAKQEGSKRRTRQPPQSLLRQEVIRGFEAKLLYNPHIASLLLDSGALPFRHYYQYEDKIVDQPRHQWQCDYWMLCREVLREGDTQLTSTRYLEAVSALVGVEPPEEPSILDIWG